MKLGAALLQPWRSGAVKLRISNVAIARLNSESEDGFADLYELLDSRSFGDGGLNMCLDLTGSNP